MLLSFAFHAFALRREPGWYLFPRYTALTALLSFVLLAILVLVGSDPSDPLFAVGGLIQRALLLVSFGWLTIVGLRILGDEFRPARLR